jgi:phosphoglycerol transferase MdoB-like AlkP superfamily enzyme
VPTAISQLGEPFTHQCWGRDLLALPADDPGFAVIKPSGSDATTAIVVGGEILVRTPAGVARLYDYRLAPLAATPVHNEGETARLTQNLIAYLSTATRALLADSVAAQAPASERHFPAANAKR